LKYELIDWLSSSPLNVFATVSLKQGIKHDDGCWASITNEHITKTAWLLRDRVTKAVVGKKAKIPFLVFVEGDGVVKRKHLHIATFKPMGIQFYEFSDTFRFKAMGLDWVYNEIDIRPIETYTERRVISYSLKERMDAFIPEASFVPLMN
jgi:hypothetical protein